MRFTKPLQTNYISTHIFIEIKWLVDFRKDPLICLNENLENIAWVLDFLYQ